MGHSHNMPGHDMSGHGANHNMTMNDKSSMSGMDHSHMGMSMVFGNSWKTTPVVIASWLPSSRSEYVATFFAIIFMTIFFRFISVMRAFCDTYFAPEEESKAAMALCCPVNREGVVQPVIEQKGNAEISVTSQNDYRKSQRQLLKQQLKHTSFYWKRDIPKVLLSFLQAMVGYFLMLIAMTYVVSYFFALCLGIALGELLFGRVGAGGCYSQSDSAALH